LNESHKLAKEAFTIPFDQWSYIQHSIVNQATKLELLPPKGSPPQTNIKQLVRLGDELPLAIHMDKNRDYLSSNAAMWQFLQDNASAGASQGKSALLAVAYQILADGSFLQLIN
jgi:hypothetical protein